MLVNEAIANHRLLWHTIAKICRDENERWEYCDGGEAKVKAFAETGLGEYEDYNMGCFCCDYVGFDAKHARENDYEPCKYCPLDWGVKFRDLDAPPCCLSDFDEFGRAIEEGEFKIAAEYADRIAELPINPYYEGKGGI